MEEKKHPTCNEAKCVACEGGVCAILNRNDFGGRECPFFKTKEQLAKEKAYCEKRLAEIKITEV